MSNSDYISVLIMKPHGKQFKLKCKKDCKVLELKEAIAKQENVEVLRQRIVFRAQELNDNENIQTYKIENNSHLILVIRQNISQETKLNKYIIYFYILRNFVI